MNIETKEQLVREGELEHDRRNRGALLQDLAAIVSQTLEVR